MNVVGEFSVEGRNDVLKLELGKGETRVETDLKVQGAIHTAFHHMIPHSSLLPAAFVPETFREQHSGAADRKWRHQVKSKMISCLDTSWKETLQITIHSCYFKVLKSYYLLEPKTDCKQVSISVKVEGKVQYTGGWVCTTDHNSPDHKQEITPICLHSPDHGRLRVL